MTSFESLGKIAELNKIIDNLTKEAKQHEYELGKYILQAALDANYQFMVVQGNPETTCVNPERTWSAASTRQILDLSGDRYLAFYQGTVSRSRIGNWYFCMT